MKKVLLFLFTLFITISYGADNTFKDILLIINYNFAHYESIPFLRKIYQDYVPNIIFFGPEKDDQVLFLPHHNGYLSYQCIAQAMKKYPNYKGYLFLMDDCILNFWLLKGLDISKIWYPEISFLNSTKGNPINVKRGQQATSWQWWHTQWGYPAVSKAFDDIPDNYKKILSENWGQNNVVANYSDIFYIPAEYKEKFIELADIFAKHDTFLEVALPTIISCCSLKKDWIWLVGHGPDRKRPCQDFKKHLYFNHPIKLSYPEHQKFIADIFEQVKSQPLLPKKS